MELETLENKQLLADGVTVADVESSLHPAEQVNLPWIAKLLLGVGGWLTAIFVIGFSLLMLNDSFRSNEESGALIIGTIYLAGSIFISRINPHSFLTQLTIALGTAGYALMMFGLWDIGDGLVSFMISIFLCPAILFLSRNIIQKYSATLAIFFVWWIYHVSSSRELSSSLPLVISVIVACILLSGILKSGFWRPVLFGTLSGLLFLLYLPLFPDRYINDWTQFDPIVLSAATAIAFGTVTWSLTRPKNSQGLTLIIGFGIILFLIAYFGCAGIAACLAIIVAGHARNDQSVKWAGIIGLSVFVIAFYYFLGKPLLTKSYLLIATGIGLVAISTCVRLINTPDNS